MSYNPLNELKRRLVDETIPLSKRLRLAKNVVRSHHFPAAPKERVIAEWLNELMQENKISSNDLRDIIGWLNSADDVINEYLKHKLIKVVAQYIHINMLQDDDIMNIIIFLESNKISFQLSLQIENFMFITTTLLKSMQNDVADNVQNVEAVFNRIIQYYKESKKKLEFISKFVSGEYLEQIFSFLDTECHEAVINICQSILYPATRKQHYIQFFRHLIKEDNIHDLVLQQGDKICLIMRIMRSFFSFPTDRIDGDHRFLTNFIHVFVSCFREESQIIFAFYIIASNTFIMPQNYLIPVMKMPPIVFEEHNDKIKRNIFLHMIDALLINEIDVRVHLTDILGEKITNVEAKKTFLTFLQTLMLGQLKLEGKLDKTTLNIIRAAIKLEPSLVEQKMDQILPHIMIAKKNNTEFLHCYTEMVNFLLATLFKLSRGTEFIKIMIPHLKVSLEAGNVEQFELKQKLNEATNNGDNYEKIKGKIITGKDIFPQDCIETYGKLTSELLFRQNKDLLISLQKDFEENCLMMLEEGFVSPSIITLTETLSAILSSFFHHSKMADHTVPINIAEEFWSTFQDFEHQCLNKFGECILKLNYNPPLVEAFLKLCSNFSHLKLLNLKYSNTKLKIIDKNLIPFLNKDKWIAFVIKLQEEEANLLWFEILLTKIIAIELIADNSEDNSLSILISDTKTNLIKQIIEYPQILMNDNYITSNLFKGIDKNQIKLLTRAFMKSYEYYANVKIFKSEALFNNKELLQAIVYKLLKNICDCLENGNVLSKSLSKNSFDITVFVKEVDVKEYFTQIAVKNQDVIEDIIDVLKYLHIQYLEERFQLAAIFVLLILKNCCQSKKLKRNIDHILHSIYELSIRHPDLYKLFPIDFIFDFENTQFLDLLKLTFKTPNETEIIKNILETAVRKVKNDPKIVKEIVDILLRTFKSKGVISSIEYFKEPVFQISCIILPLITKHKKTLTNSAYRSILADLQDKLNKAMLDSFRNIDFTKKSGNLDDSSNPDVVEEIPESIVATLNAMDAYTLTLLKCCESSDEEEFNDMNCLYSGLEFFIDSAITSLENPFSKHRHIESSVQLLNVSLRYIKKLESHPVFENRDELLHKIWRNIRARMILVYNEGKKGRVGNTFLDDIGVTLKFLAELSSLECFVTHFVNDLSNMGTLKKPSILLKNAEIINYQVTSRKVTQFMWQHCLKANVIEPKCVALTKLCYRTAKNIKFWVQQHFFTVNIRRHSIQVFDRDPENEETGDKSVRRLTMEDSICELLRCDLDMVSDAILTAKKIKFDYRFLDTIFDLHHLMHFVLGRKHLEKLCDISWFGFVCIYDGCVAILNNLLLSREELLEDRWPCYIECYKALVQNICERCTVLEESDKDAEHQLAEMAHAAEKLTQSICKRRVHVTRLAAYAVADICTCLEKNLPPKMVRQHIENSVVLLLAITDSVHAMGFLRRSLAGSIGQTTLMNMYTAYKRYHKYVGNS